MSRYRPFTTLGRARAGGMEGTRFLDEPAPGGATTRSRFIERDWTPPLRQGFNMAILAYPSSFLPKVRSVRCGGLRAVCSKTGWKN